MNTDDIVEKIKNHKKKILFLIGTISLIGIYNYYTKRKYYYGRFLFFLSPYIRFLKLQVSFQVT